MTSELAYCTLGRHEVRASEMRKPPPAAPNRRQCNACAAARKRSHYKRKPSFDWASRFLERIHDTGDCWEWTGALSRGYGVTTIQGVQWHTHRVSYLLHFGDLPSAAFICHHCDNKKCCNPDHLYAGDVQTNSDDAVARGRLDPPRGEQQGLHKLTTAQVIAIRTAYAAGGHSQSSLARQYRVSPSNIGKVVGYQSWRHVA